MIEPEPAAAVTIDPVAFPKSLTAARLALGRAGAGMPTHAALAFAVAHAEARDAIHASLDIEALAGRLAALNLSTVEVESAAPDRATYLRRPDFGRRLSRNARSVLAARTRDPHDVTIVIGDGLSAHAVALNAAPLVAALVPLLTGTGLTIGPVVVVRQARVAVGDEIGATVGGRLVVMLIGERPGLSAADSLGAYLTFAPRVGRTDAERNCVSNIRNGGLPPAVAARTIAWLATQALRRQLTGVGLKDESGALGLATPVHPALPG